jgi:VanZ family protein
LAAALLAAMLFGLFWGGAQPFAVGLFAEPWDKVAHASVFCVMAVLLRVGMGLPIAAALVLPMLVGAADEWHQLYLPGRDGSVDDWLADAVGAALGVAIGVVLARFAVLRK